MPLWSRECHSDSEGCNLESYSYQQANITQLAAQNPSALKHIMCSDLITTSWWHIWDLALDIARWMKNNVCLKFNLCAVPSLVTNSCPHCSTHITWTLAFIAWSALRLMYHLLQCILYLIRIVLLSRKGKYNKTLKKGDVSWLWLGKDRLQLVDLESFPDPTLCGWWVL